MPGLLVMSDPGARKIHYLSHSGHGMGSKPVGLTRLEARVTRLKITVESHDRRIKELKLEMKKKDKALADLKRENSELRSFLKSEKRGAGSGLKVRRLSSVRRTTRRRKV